MRNGDAICRDLGGHRFGRGWKFRCPCHHDERPSCVLFDDGGVWCFAGCPRDQVEAALDARGFTDDGQHQYRSAAEREADLVKSINAARMRWHLAGKFDGDRLRSEMERRLRRRGITLPAPRVLRPLEWEPNGYIAAVHRLDGALTAVHERDSIDPGSKRLTYGHLGDGAVRLVEPEGDELGLAEGIETAMSAAQMFDVPCWATLGSERLGAVAIPAGIRRVHVFADSDQPGRDGAEAAVERYCERERRHVTVHWPPDDCNDFNDALMGRTTNASR
jgi:putative DNA primase/helicase